MKKIEISSYLEIDRETFADAALNMRGVNYELNPLVHMTAPEPWKGRPLSQWPVNEELFSSIIFLFYVLPVDRHFFRLKEVAPFYMQEESRSLMNPVWRHTRKIEESGKGLLISDVVEFESRFAPLEVLALPLYRWVFSHRHRRLVSRYGGRTE